MNRFYVSNNEFLTTGVTGYFHQYYTGYNQPNNPDFINTLKNTYNSEPHSNLIAARDKVKEILTYDIPRIIQETNMSNAICICVPRAKALRTYSNSQLMFKDAIRIATSNIRGTIDGTDCIIRETNTFTTHLSKATRDGKISNDGERPYPGITKDTCKIDRIKIKNKNIILIEDIYTKSINIDEDCIQALYDNGAADVAFYSIAYTRRI